jgi:hypothetical protein
LVAATLARYGLLKYGKPKIVATPVVDDVGRSADVLDDIGSLTF